MFQEKMADPLKDQLLSNYRTYINYYTDTFPRTSYTVLKYNQTAMGKINYMVYEVSKKMKQKKKKSPK